MPPVGRSEGEQPRRETRRSEADAEQDLEKFRAYAHRCVRRLQSALQLGRGAPPAGPEQVTRLVSLREGAFFDDDDDELFAEGGEAEEECVPVGDRRSRSLTEASGSSAARVALHGLYRQTADKKSSQHDRRGKHSGQIEAIATCILKTLKGQQQRRPGHSSSAPPVVVELGAGRGLLGKLVSSMGGMPLVVVDLKEVRTGFEKASEPQAAGAAQAALKSTEPPSGPAAFNLVNAYSSRITQDIGDLDIEKIRSSQGGARPLVLIAKHLCSGASDVAVRMCVRAFESSTAAAETAAGRRAEPESDPAALRGAMGSFPSSGHVAPPPAATTPEIPHHTQPPTNPGVLFALAPCCHHKNLQYETYAGRDWWEKQGLSDREFALAKQLIFLSKVPGLHDQNDHTCRRWKLRAIWTAAELKRLGLLARRAVEEGRLQCLRSQSSGHCSIHTLIVEYCLPSLTPDNFLLLASTEPIELGPAFLETHLLPALESDPGSSGETAAEGKDVQLDSVQDGLGTLSLTTRRRETGLLVKLVPKPVYAAQGERVSEFLQENRDSVCPMMESCHACDAALGIQVVMSKTGKRDAATDHRNMLITAAPRSSSDPDPLPALCNALLQQPLLASAFDQFYPFRAVFDVLKAEKLFELTAEKPLGCGDNAAFELCELSEDSLEHYVTEELRAAVRLHFGDVSSPEACSNNPFLLKVHVCPRGSLLAKVIDMASVLLEKVVLEVLGPDIASKDSVEKVARMAAGSNQNTRTLCVGLWRGHGAVSCVGISLTRVADEFDPARLGPDMRRALPGSTSLGKCWRHRLYELSLRAHSNQIAEDVELLGEFERVLSLDSASSPAVVFHPGTVLAAGETGQFLDCLPGLPTFALHGADILTSRPEESAVAPLVLLDLGPRAGWQRAVDLLVEACVTWGPRPELFILRLTASDCGKADQRRGYKGWQQSVTIRVFSALRERIGTDHSLSLQVNHLLSDEGAERTLLLRRRAKTELPCQS